MITREEQSTQQERSEEFDYVEKEIDEDLICSICLLPFIDPISHISCGNTFCSKCVESVANCPMCGEGEFKKNCAPSVKMIRNLLDKLKVKCGMCKNIVLRGELKDHQVKYCPLHEAYQQVEQFKKKLEQQFIEMENSLKSEHEKLMNETTKKLAVSEASLQTRIDEFENEKLAREKLENSNKPIHLNVRGKIMTVSLGDFIHNEIEPDNLFKKMFTGQHPCYQTSSKKFNDPIYFIDCKLVIFEFILEWLQYGSSVGACEMNNDMKQSLLNTCSKFGLSNLKNMLTNNSIQDDSNCSKQIQINGTKETNLKEQLSQVDFTKIISLTSNLRFKNLDMTKLDLSKLDLQKSEIIECNFTGMNLNGTNFKKSNLRGCNFTNCNLTSSNLQDCNLSECNFTNSILENANISLSNLYGANFFNAKFKGTILVSSKFGLENNQPHPIGKSMPHRLDVILLCTENGGRATKYTVELPKQSTVKVLATQFGKISGRDPQKLQFFGMAGFSIERQFSFNDSVKIIDPNSKSTPKVLCVDVPYDYSPEKYVVISIRQRYPAEEGKFKGIGIPFILFVKREISTKGFYDILWSHLQRVAKKSPEDPETNTNPTKEDGQEYPLAEGIEILRNTVFPAFDPANIPFKFTYIDKSVAVINDTCGIPILYDDRDDMVSEYLQQHDKYYFSVDWFDVKMLKTKESITVHVAEQIITSHIV